MNVELYQEQESMGTTEEMDLHREISEALGLESQKSLTSGDRVDGYRGMTEQECFVFGMHFPNRVKIENYKSLIPTRVLQEVKHFKECHPELEVWLLCPEPGKIDPVVVGTKHGWNFEYMFRGDTLLIARFGGALEDFSTLTKQAIEEVSRRVKHVESLPFSQLTALAKVFND